MSFLNKNEETMPNWEEWRKESKRRLWKLIALSLNVESNNDGAMEDYKSKAEYKKEYERRRSQARNALRSCSILT